MNATPRVLGSNKGWLNGLYQNPVTLGFSFKATLKMVQDYFENVFSLKSLSSYALERVPSCTGIGARSLLVWHSCPVFLTRSITFRHPGALGSDIQRLGQTGHLL